ncbi:ABC transporter ATP-binding protein [Anaerocolumna sp. MB42-C2]|uniref:ABC transporter ATP-binding protein n=1 Tax=Anaerocolumna sp. MB42-C2 TaxID=3070997 RepID=UPI0027E07B15|nr:ABC transporter ATP-binding protein [Anaerocolumna sp. MB42-C2]WMJ86515.1 ABC transporter ATP-binding protein [Anaerocolumna sp. MB42-C2]
MDDMIKLQEVTKKYKYNEVVSNVSMSVKKGQIYGFLGPNGAGKTTIMKMILNLVKPTSGIIEVFGDILNETSYTYLKKIGNIIEYPVFYDKLTVRDNLRLHCEYMGFYDYKEIDKVLELVHLDKAGKKPVTEFSLGMKQRLGIARAMITNPELLILDEPINGLDPMGIKEMRELFLKIKKQYNTTILISSHIITEIEQVADVIGIINNGKFVKEVTMEEIKKENLQYLEVQVDNLKKAATLLDSRFNTNNYKVVSDSGIRIYDETVTQKDLCKELVLAGVNVYGVTSKSDNLEDYFMNLINGGIQQ